MEIWLVLCSVLLLSSMTLLFLVVREHRRSVETLAAKSAETVATVVSVHESQAQLLDKAIAILSSKGPLEFQALQAMNQSGLYTDDRYDPSDEAEADKLKAFGIVPADEEGFPDGLYGSPTDELDWLRDHGVPG